MSWYNTLFLYSKINDGDFQTEKMDNFMEVWAESLPDDPAILVELQIATSASMQKLAFRGATPEYASRDFFWFCGAP
jgi:hypothetical protein